LVLLVSLVAGIVLAAAGAFGASLEIAVRLDAGGKPLALDSLRYTDQAGQTVSVTRLAFLLSDFRLQTGDGRWTELQEEFAYIDAGRGRLEFRLENVPPDSYKQLAFTVGLDEKTNRADPTRWPADHPLNPVLNTLHWSWQGGYVFFALEGHYDNEAGFSLHLATSTNQTPVALAVPLELRRDTHLDVALDVLGLLDSIRLAPDAAATHSRAGDPLAAAFRANIARAFTAGAISVVNNPAPAAVTQALIATNATLYQFHLPVGFPIPPLPRDNPLTVEGVALGDRLFHETLLSRDNTLSCASCHKPEHAFTDSPRRFSLGVDKLEGTRNAMSLFNLAWKTRFFWDGRAPSIRVQVLGPIQDAKEMHESIDRVVEKLAAAPGYPEQFEKAFGSRTIDADRLGRALEQYVLTLTSYDSKFDRAMRGQAQLTADEKRGFELFATEYDPRRGLKGADCFHCHGGPLFSDFRFLNNGLDGVTNRFVVPSLRNVAVTGPYMHDGRFATLEDVVEHYSTGVKRNPQLDPNLAKHPDGGVPLSAADKRALVAFLKTLTDERFGPTP
jgi:cytochrome c peroxidase